jgi:hypothetical protein
MHMYVVNTLFSNVYEIITCASNILARHDRMTMFNGKKGCLITAHLNFPSLPGK